MKAIRWLLKLVLVMITLPLILAVWLAKWFVVFLHHCSACRTLARSIKVGKLGVLVPLSR